MIIDHIGLGVGDYDKAKQFYSAALAPLGLSLLMKIVQDGIDPDGHNVEAVCHKPE